ncbi:ribonuclease T2 family protein [Rodentibacter pneumotropicus]|uniref:ribonuclease T2 family protein n=1 Tax=Rodentibacter pneumotropicus TaxID=758 RepID=UPI000987C064|nr:ribonuclease [Rodentibacter pneumotropicus]OOF64217.1 ribonuclease [Rodentibacter pneumotropicus]THA18420.1 ribonuclease [Rodentibacter pneumotropicus]
MKKQLSTLSIIVLAAFSIWQYFSENQKFSSQAESSTPKKDKSAVKNIDIFADYDVIMRDDPIGQNANAPVDYYMLVLSWSPGFCASQREKYGNQLPSSAQYQCENNRTFGWVVHGLWPQNANARSVADHPRFCQGDLPVLAKSIVEPYLTLSPGAKLLQGEWEKHGSCAFNSAEQYFAKEQELFNGLRLPKENLSRSELFRWMKQNNPQLKNAYLGASRNELFICYNKQWQVIDCQK